MPELIVIMVIALLVVGPKRLPELARTFGKGLSEFRRATEGATETLKESLHMEDIKQEADELKETILQGANGDTVRPESFPASEDKKEVPRQNVSIMDHEFLGKRISNGNTPRTC